LLLRNVVPNTHAENRAIYLGGLNEMTYDAEKAPDPQKRLGLDEQERG